jgi:hypothetical protein
MKANGFLQAPNGNFSSARLMFMIGLFYAMGMTTSGLFFLGWTAGEGMAFFGAISMVFVGLKLGQQGIGEPGPTDAEK